LSSGEPRNFPYLGNLPTIHWGGKDPKLEARRVVSRAARETLRYMYNRKGLALMVGEDDKEIALASAPEALTLAQLGIPSGAGFIYPDPPLAEQELQVLQTLVSDAT